MRNFLVAFFFLLGMVFSEGNNSNEELLTRNKRAVGTPPRNVDGACGGVRTGKYGYIASPNFPHSEYPPNSDCEWKIIVRRNQVIRFEFLFMDMENGPKQLGGDCGNDWLIIYDGRDDTFPLVGSQKYCGSTVQFRTVYSTSYFVLIQFHSDLRYQQKGFAIRYTSVDPEKTTFNCNFDARSSMCKGWTQSQNDDFDWEFASGPTPTGRRSLGTGPPNDHTKNSFKGTYAFIEASLKKKGSKAVMITPIRNLSVSDMYCFRFWYHMNGRGIGSLLVYQLDVDELITNTSELIFEKHGAQSLDWLEARIQIPRAKTNKQFAFAGVRGRTSSGDIAIDDISIKPGACPIITTTAAVTTAPPTTPRRTTRPRRTTPPATTSPETTRPSVMTRRPTFAFTFAPLRPTYPTSLESCGENTYNCRNIHICITAKDICDGIQDCPENDDENQDCGRLINSVTKCSFAEWTEWSQCSRTCGGGSRKKERATINGKPGDIGCEGISLITENCNTCSCETWMEWGSWGECGVTCGKGGLRSRSRICNRGSCTEADCIGFKIEFFVCNSHNCPKWGGFSAWSSCSVTCGNGVVTRTRKCEGGKIGEDGCTGNTTEVQTCTEVIPNFPACSSSLGIECPPRNDSLISFRRRKCPPSCDTDADCDSGLMCNCDGICGKTCSNPSTTCRDRFTNLRSSPTLNVTCSNGVFVGSQCVFSCGEGHTLVGQPDFNCQSNGRWDKTRMPQCQILSKDVICGSDFLRVYQQGRTFSCTNGVSVNSVCTISCASGYRRVGPKKRTCQPSGNWKNGIASCRQVTTTATTTTVTTSPGGKCGADFLQINQAGRTISCTNGINFRSMCKISCANGYVRVGPGRRICRKNGKWNSGVARCYPTTTPVVTMTTKKATTLPSSNVLCPSRFFSFATSRRKFSCTAGVNVWSVCTTLCESGYERRGPPTRMCKPDGSWNISRLAWCKPIRSVVTTTTASLTIFKSTTLACSFKASWHNRCCGSRSYNSTKGFCCGTRLFARSKVDGCCGKRPYLIAKRGCCTPGTTYKKATQGCCGGGKVYEISTHTCENNQVTLINSK